MREGLIDAVIPVHNAPDSTRRCIRSLFETIGTRIGTLHVCDDASDAETAEMLDRLEAPRLVIHRARENVGFGATVNLGVGKTRTPLVLVLNSDVRARSDFLSPLVDALEADPGLAAVTPRVAPIETRCSYQRTGGVIPTYAFRAFGFLVRRKAFDAARGFDPVFGRGYYEDTDLSRRWTALGWRMGVVPDSVLDHEGHASFGQTGPVLELRARNREIYLRRYPGARHRILLVSGDLPAGSCELVDATRAAVTTGAALDWLSRSPIRGVPAFEIRARRHETLRTLRRLARKRDREPQRYTQLWLAGRLGADAPPLRGLARSLGIEVREISTKSRP